MTPDERRERIRQIRLHMETATETALEHPYGKTEYERAMNALYFLQLEQQQLILEILSDKETANERH